ncbi:MAG: hypothetical protein LQ341_004945 [Variospora aurantia]|nr:MAG: hypothetical protein LQ341_004945 [Variospora aurantia]
MPPHLTSSSASYSEVYSLAESCRAKLAGRIGAKDQSLRTFVAHARLYDTLADTVEEMRERAARRPTASPQHPRNTVKRKYGSNAAPDEMSYQDGSVVKDMGTGKAWTKTEHAPDRSIIRADYDSPAPMDVGDQTSVSVTELDHLDEYDMDEKASNLPATISVPNLAEADEADGEAESEPDPESDSSDSDSDCSSDPDGASDPDHFPGINANVDPVVGTAENVDLPLPISRPKTPHRQVRWADLPPPAPKAPSNPRGRRPKSQDLPALQPYINTARKPIRFVHKSTPAVGIISTKGTPLSPQLCEKDSDDLSPMKVCLDEPSNSLQQRREPCPDNHEASSANGNALSRYLFGIGSWRKRTPFRNTGEGFAAAMA